MSSHRSHRSSHHSDDDRKDRSHDKKSSKDRPRLPKDIDPISRDDYYEKANEFRLWLKEEKQKYMDELSSDDARHYFKKFVKAWNRYELEDKFYNGINPSQLASSDTTRYKWSFAKNLDRLEMDTIRDGVDRLTRRSNSSEQHGHSGHRRNVGPSFPQSSHDQADRELKEEREHAERKAEARRKRQRQEEYLDHVAPKETGREAQIAKRRAMTAYHKRERSPDVELSESDLMGSDDFQSRLASQKRVEERRNARREEQQQLRTAPLREKLEEYRVKESATIEMFKKMAEEQKKRGGL